MITCTIYEDVIGLMQEPKTDAETLTMAIEDVLIRCSIPLNKCRGQAYDGASNMSGPRSGVAARILHEELTISYSSSLLMSLYKYPKRALK